MSGGVPASVYRRERETDSWRNRDNFWVYKGTYTRTRMHTTVAAVVVVVHAVTLPRCRWMGYQGCTEKTVSRRTYGPPPLPPPVLFLKFSFSPLPDARFLSILNLSLRSCRSPSPELRQSDKLSFVSADVDSRDFTHRPPKNTIGIETRIEFRCCGPIAGIIGGAGGKYEFSCNVRVAWYRRGNVEG